MPTELSTTELRETARRHNIKLPATAPRSKLLRALIVPEVIERELSHIVLAHAEIRRQEEQLANQRDWWVSVSKGVVSYRTLAKWAGLTSSRISQIVND